MPQHTQADHQLELRKMRPQGRVLHNLLLCGVFVLPSPAPALGTGRPIKLTIRFPTDRVSMFLR